MDLIAGRWLTAFQVVQIALTCVVEGVSTTTATELTLFSGPKPWNTAYLFCRSLGQQLVTSHSASKQQAVVDVLKKLNGTRDVWLGVASLKYGGSDYIAADCTTQTYFHWDVDEPNYLDTDLCVRGKISHSSQIWGTRNCNASEAFMCERTIGPCWLEEVSGRGLNTYDTTNQVTSVQDCQDLCLVSNSTSGYQCAAAHFRSDIKECALQMNISLHVADSYTEYSSSAAPSHTLLIKRCFNYSRSDIAINFTKFGDFPEMTCDPVETDATATTGSSSSSSPRDATKVTTYDTAEDPMTTPRNATEITTSDTAENPTTTLRDASEVTTSDATEDPTTTTRDATEITTSDTDEDTTTVTAFTRDPTSITTERSDRSTHGTPSRSSEDSTDAFSRNDPVVTTVGNEEDTASVAAELTTANAAACGNLLSSDESACSVAGGTSEGPPEATGETTTGTKLCSCRCSQINQKIKAATHEVQRELLVPREQLSKSRRKLTSAPDTRPSAHAMGWVGLSFIGGLLALLLLSDCLRMVRFLQAKGH